jgi:hypothetical protein
MRKSIIVLIIVIVALLPAGVLAEVNPAGCLRTGDCPVLCDRIPDQYRNLLNQENWTQLREKIKTSVIEIDGEQYTVPQIIQRHQGLLTRLGQIYPGNWTGTCGDMCNKIGNKTGTPVDCQAVCQDLIRRDCLPLCEDSLYFDGYDTSLTHPAGMPPRGGSPSLDGRVPRISAGPDEYLPYL